MRSIACLLLAAILFCMLWRAILVEQTKEEPDHCEGACQDEREQLAKVDICRCGSARLSIPAPPPYANSFVLGPAVINTHTPKRRLMMMMSSRQTSLRAVSYGKKKIQNLSNVGERVCVLFIGTQFSNLYTAVGLPLAERVCVVYWYSYQ